MLQTILAEIEDLKKQKFDPIHPMSTDKIGVWCCDKIAEIIRSHMEDEPVCNPCKLDGGWISVEDVVRAKDSAKAIVLDIHDEYFDVLVEDGCAEEWYKNKVTKTGRHIDIQGLLK